MSQQFLRLFSPLAIGKHLLRNRIVFGAHAANMAVNGLPTERHVAYYAERAKGGAGMIVVEPMPVHPAAILTRRNFRACDDSVISQFKKIVSAIEDNGAVAVHLLAGLQPRRAQILDLLAWYERQLAKLGVDVRLNCYMEAADVMALATDAVILATGSLPPDTGFQKALPALETLPGIAKGSVFSIEAVMGRQARLGKRVLVLDEGGGWRGGGTAWKLAEEGHVVTILTPDPFVGKELQRTTADVPLRRTLRKLGVDWRLEVSIAEWHGDGATILDHNSGEKSFLAADCLVLATTNVPANWLASELAATGIAFVEIGDCAAPRQAPYAFFEGRKIALSL